MKERIKDILGFIGIVLLLWFLAFILINGSHLMDRAHERCAQKGGELDKYQYCIIQPK